MRSPTSSIDAGGVERGQPRRLLRPVVQRRRIERQDLAARVLLVEALARLLADPAALDQRLDERRQRETRARRRRGKPLGQVARHVREDVDAGDVHRAERRALRPAERRAGDRVDLFDRELAGRRALEDLHHAVEADVVGDEVRRVLRDDHALAEPMIGELARRASTTAGSVSAVGISSSSRR